MFLNYPDFLIWSVFRKKLLYLNKKNIYIVVPLPPVQYIICNDNPCYHCTKYIQSTLSQRLQYWYIFFSIIPCKNFISYIKIIFFAEICKYSVTYLFRYFLGAIMQLLQILDNIIKYILHKYYHYTYLLLFLYLIVILL